MRPNTQRAAKAGETYALLLAEARRLFGSAGYSAVGVRDITEAARVSRGALAHHFGGKEELFLRVFLEIEQDIANAAAHPGKDLTGLDALDRFRAGVETYLDAASHNETQRISFIDGPAVLGWQRWRSLEEDFYLGMMIKSMERAAAEGAIISLPPRTLALMIFGSVTEAALMIAHASDPQKKRREAGFVLDRFFCGLRTGGSVRSPGAASPPARPDKSQLAHQNSPGETLWEDRYRNRTDVLNGNEEAPCHVNNSSK